MSSPFDTLGVPDDASAAEVRRARRDLARTLHPDVGGDAATMRALNDAAAEALALIAASSAIQGAPAPRTESIDSQTEWTEEARDSPSFTIEALPAEAFEALVLAAAELGEVEDDDPPYELRTLLREPIACWCRLDILPDAGASTVGVAIAAVDGGPLPSVIEVRNVWILTLNALDWSTL